MENKVYITDVFWERVFLKLVITGYELENKEIYIYSKKSKFLLNLEKIEENKYQAKINITNIENGKMLENADYMIKMKLEEEKYQVINILPEVGYKLQNLDRIFRYYKAYYAYTINFEIKQTKDDNIAFVIKSRYMKVNKNPNKFCRIKKNNTVPSLIKLAIKNVAESSLQILYKCFSIINYNKENHILLMSETRSPIGGNLKALDERLKKRGIDKTYKISYWFNKTLEERKRKLIFKWFKLIWLISKQSYIFVDDYSPIFKFITLSKKTKLIQVWHAGVGFKSVGYARFGFGGPEPYKSCHRKYDYAIVGSKNLIPIYEEVFGISKEKILPYGLPRLDNYLDEKKIKKVSEKIYKTYPEIKNKKVILFAPTYRGRDQKRAYYPYEKINLEAVYNICEQKDYMFLIKMHPFINKKLEIPEEYSSRIKDVSNYGNINDLFYITNILITDYSSNVYDFSMLNRPIILYTFDLDKYQLINKTQRPVKDYSPGKICNTFEEVITSIENEDFCLEKLKKYREECFDNINSNSSDLIIDNIILRGKK